MRDQPTCNLWTNDHQKYVDSFCEHEGFIHELPTTTLTPDGGRHHWGEQGRSTDFCLLVILTVAFYEFYCSSKCV